MSNSNSSPQEQTQPTQPHQFLTEQISFSHMNTSKGTERIKHEGAMERTVETVDHRSPAGGGKEPQTEKVEVTHVPRPDVDPGSGGAFVEAAAKVAEKLESAEEAISESFGQKDGKKTN